MKFKAVISEPPQMRHLLNLATTFSKISRQCVLAIETQKVCFLARNEIFHHAPFVWCEIKKDTLFSHFTMDGDEEGKIYISFNPSYLSSSLSLLKSSVHLVKLKLMSKDDHPTLGIEIHVTSKKTDNIRITNHDIPIKIIPAEDWYDYKIPSMPDPATLKLRMVLPSLRSLKQLIDRLKNLADNAIWMMQSDGELKIAADTDDCTISNSYKCLDIDYQDRGENTNDDILLASCCIELKKIHMLLSSLHFQPYKMLGSIEDDKLLYINVCMEQNLVINCLISALVL